MRSAFIDCAIGIAMAAVLFASGMAMGFVINRLPVAAGDAATWASAFLAGLAFCGTIWIATAESRRRRNIEMLTGQLIAASLTLRATDVHGAMNMVVRNLQYATGPDDSAELFINLAGALAAVPRWTVSEILPVAGYSPTLAARMGQAVDQIGAAVSILSNAGHEKINWTTDERVEEAKNMMKTFRVTALNLKSIADQCRELAEHLVPTDVGPA